tara:strand:- start:1292 stop:1879 length:588 start_codon:yes stop_codon:yes gene_type:complete
LATAAAVFVKLNNPDFSEAEIRQAIELTSSKYAIDEFGSPNLRAMKIPNAGIGNAFKAITAKVDVTNLTNSIVKHRFQYHNDGVKSIFLEELIKSSGKENVCHRYNVSWGDFNNEVKSLSYEIFQSNSNEEKLTIGNSILIPTFNYDERKIPRTIINMSGYSRLGVQACKNGNCGDITEFDFSEAQIPNICLTKT